MKKSTKLKIIKYGCLSVPPLVLTFNFELIQGLAIVGYVVGWTFADKLDDIIRWEKQREN